MSRKLKYNLQVGDKFGSLTVVKLYAKRIVRQRRQRGKIAFRMEYVHQFSCDCGNKECYLAGNTVASGIVKTCGCKNLFFGKGDDRAFRAILRKYKESANLRNILWKVEDEDIIKLFSLPCFYCGIEPRTVFTTMEKGGGERLTKYNGIDRLENGSGYMPSNIVPCCSFCNRTKNNLSSTEFLIGIKRIAKYLNILEQPISIL